MSESKIVQRLAQCIKEIQDQDIRIMEVCGTHTRAVSKSGIRHLLPQQVKLLSGPGCPVCVTSEFYIDKAIEISDHDNVMLVTFGDMIRVNGTNGSLADNRAKGAAITAVYSPEDALVIADKNRNKLIVFAAAGFETTAPLIAATVKLTEERGLNNLLFLTALKCMEPVIRFILQDKRNRLDALICPGHVASIKGADYFRFISDEFGVPAVVCGFEPIDIAAGICILLEQLTGKRNPEFTNLYTRCVRYSGNRAAQCIMNEVFATADGVWRGIGTIRASALVLNEKYEHLDAAKRFGLDMNDISQPQNCLCSEILLGIKHPCQCRYFGTSCTPYHPSGPCMVSSEGACAVHFSQGGDEGHGR